MKLKRPTTSDRVNRLLSKGEPEFGMMELSQGELHLALNWYSQSSEKEQSYKFLLEYCKANGIKAKAAQVEQTVSTVGFVCRMLTRGAILDSRSMSWLHTHLESLTKIVIEAPSDPVTPTIAKPAVPTVDQQSNKIIGLLEGAVDELILSGFTKAPDTLSILRAHGLHGPQGPTIINFFKQVRDEYRLAMTGKDEQLNEGYSNYTEPQMKKMESLYDEIVSNTLSVMNDPVVTPPKAIAVRTPRKKKVRTPEQQVKSLQFCPEDTQLKIKSVPPTRMIGAEGVWVYNRTTRMLSYYAADSEAGLGAKGCALLNYSTTKSRTKKLRKPEGTLPTVLTGGKVALKNLFDSLTTKDAKVTGRVNKETLLVRVTV